MINKIGAYKAALMLLNDDVHAFVLRRDGRIHGQSLPIVTENNEFESLGVYDIRLAWIGFTDESTKTEVFVFEDLIESNPSLEDVVFEVENLETINIYDQDKEAVPVEALLGSADMQDIFDELFNDVFEKKPKWTKN
jgi:hypothetical protein